ncbi:Zinc finger C2H2-type,P-loop containing nucleoside triphosphate hydrolase,Matrin/U1-C-like, C2H2- [Cinara cedri]|uniref:Zinc finger C2H2-type,P-loop containing nucleoside triphosphate hydrolase,Matrin/U1-C-like, C2H2 n=1 Tax=Cinara cedri TaxID=506608 RepID=A0A5E4MKX2_9HEMI|nr:Zinc finger C2H2-type,P-loop containing nucleoside triphosphate hydrolase,Matrin/U1-C-like, C2H2- [Cinara cedri]
MVWNKLLLATLKRNNFVAFLAAAAAPNPGILCCCYCAFRSGRYRLRRHVMDACPPLIDRPLFAVVGCTGTGKTKLGVRLAKELDGEVVSADSIQVYKGLDVATNKATEEETEGIPHHMMGTLDWDDECNVHQYKNQALQIIRDIYSRGKVPILVGGTSYYIESIIYDNSLVSGGTAAVVGEDDVGTGDGRPGPAADADDADDAAVDLSVESFRQHATFRHANDLIEAQTVAGAGLMYANALGDALQFAWTMPAVERLPAARYRNTYVADDGGDDDDDREQWPSSVAECEMAALYAHGVRVLDAVTEAQVHGNYDVIRYPVLGTDVTAGLRQRYSMADVRNRMDVLLAATDESCEAAFIEAMRRTCAEVESRTQRLALALLTENERTAVELISPRALRAHAAYYDQAAALELHPHNTRKVFRTIQIYLTWGKRKSELFKEQRTQVTGSDVPLMALRFKEVHMMWLTCDDDVLNRRLEKRTDDMVDRGLVDELCRFKTAKLAENERLADLDYTKGVLQCIGVKQFQRYLQMPAECRGTDECRAVLADALTAMKDVTKNYAKRQRRWINNRFLKPGDKQAVSVYRLDCTDLADWPALSDQAVELALVVLGRRPRTEFTLEPMAIADENADTRPVYGEYYCNDCDRVFSNDIQYNAHMASKKHVKVMKKRKRKLQDSDNDEEQHNYPHKKL